MFWKIAKVFLEIEFKVKGKCLGRCENERCHASLVARAIATFLSFVWLWRDFRLWYSKILYTKGVPAVRRASFAVHAK